MLHLIGSNIMRNGEFYFCRATSSYTQVQESWPIECLDLVHFDMPNSICFTSMYLNSAQCARAIVFDEWAFCWKLFMTFELTGCNLQREYDSIFADLAHLAIRSEFLISKKTFRCSSDAAEFEFRNSNYDFLQKLVQKFGIQILDSNFELFSYWKLYVRIQMPSFRC